MMYESVFHIVWSSGTTQCEAAELLGISERMGQVKSKLPTSSIPDFRDVVQQELDDLVEAYCVSIRRVGTGTNST